MLKLSRAGWNNVIIFGVLAFILLINATHENVFTDEQALQKDDSFFPNSAVILTMSLNQQVTIERIGKTWRATPAVIEGQALAQMMRSWQQLSVEPTTPNDNVDPQLSLLVSIEISGQDEAINLRLNAQTDQLLIYHQQKERWYVLPLAMYDQLVPQEIFGSKLLNDDA
ncbi:hypothetical protein Q4489_00210 [Thalassotalea sp. 1_MG-2023]|uniref:hypothetical protein n=1 Tax=Thalassotalea sp. 1_MG-2023 TaxID=3062680 RepID=UPI0026E2EA67|nr:hypothetical protein [Thalassotalea sp. 1_MG-2023]MDO6425410.1 hypothetical protein [Thalassotalea sp. 1_MG-2023]